MKRKLSGLLFGLLFLTGLGILCYPTLSDQWNTYRQNQLITTYEEAVSVLEPEDYSREWEAARAFDAQLPRNNLYGDVFGEGEGDLEETEYWKVLNISGDGVMGYLSIPKINLKLSIYHGTGEAILQTGVGHLNGTKLPIGGESTHSVLAAHRGLPSARLFTDIDQLYKGDRIYIHILDETLAYEVDQILPMIDKDDMAALEEALQIEEGKDYITLFTCTPYGVNSHRLLVRGSRVAYEGEEEIISTPVETMLEAVQNYYMIYLILGLTVTILMILIMKFLFRPRRKKVKAESDGAEN
ncbi:class C sortase [Acetatifactor muris]|uniref:class C sortase n=1 Tax=Acetatifactor muris TaxID=879566 RepID=UPI0023F2231C|nr:class C sortase [Acetatifactor muris]